MKCDTLCIIEFWSLLFIFLRFVLYVFDQLTMYTFIIRFEIQFLN